MDIVIDGKPAATIVIPDEPLQVVQSAAEEFQYHVRLASGAVLPIISESKNPKGNLIILGAEAAYKAGITYGKDPHAWVIQLVNNRLYLAGDDSFGPALISQNMNNYVHKGTLFAVYDFLKKYLGVRWLFPGELGTYMPSSKNISVQVCNIQGKPAFLYSRFKDNTGVRNPEYWSSTYAANNFYKEQAKWLIRHCFCMPFDMNAYHSFTSWWDSYGKDHSEYFNLLPDGTRRSDKLHMGGGASYISMCLANTNLCKQIISNWLAKRTPFQPYIDASENDTAGKCTCDECMAMDEIDTNLGFPWNERLKRCKESFTTNNRAWWLNLGSLSDRYSRFYQNLYNEAIKYDPAVKILGFSYANYVNGPLKATMNSNIIVQMIWGWWFPSSEEQRRVSRNEWLSWSRTGATLLLRPNFMLEGHCLPLNQARKRGEDLKFVVSNNCIGTDYDSLTGQYAAQGLNLYMLARLNDQPELSVDTVLDEYYGAFGKAKNEVRAYLEYLEKVADNPPQVSIIDKLGYGSWGHMKLYGDDYYTLEIMRNARKLINTAVLASKGESLAEKRVAFLEKGLRHVELWLAVQRQWKAGFSGTCDNAELFYAYRKLVEFRTMTEPDLIANYAFMYDWENRHWTMGKSMDKGLRVVPGEKISNDWKVRRDPEGNGLSKGFESTTFNDEKWEDVSIDKSLKDQETGARWKVEHGRNYAGAVWYRTGFSLPDAKDNKLTRLVFSGLEGACTAWLNGKKIFDQPDRVKADVADQSSMQAENTVLKEESGNEKIIPVLNCGFENETEGWLLNQQSGKFKFTIDEEQFHAGGHSARLECIEKGTADQISKVKAEAWGRIYKTDIVLNPAKLYRLRLFVRTAADFKGRVRIFAANKSPEMKSTAGRWQEWVIDDIIAKENKIAIFLNVYDALGSVWFDDVVLEETKPAEKKVVQRTSSVPIQAESVEVDISDTILFDKPNSLVLRMVSTNESIGLTRPVWIVRQSPPAEANLFSDKGFEEGKGGWQLSPMSGKFQFTLDEEQHHWGKRSGRLDCVEAGDEEQLRKFKNSVWGRIFQSGIAVGKGKTYRLRLFVRTDVSFNSRVQIVVSGTADGTVTSELKNTFGRWQEITFDGIRSDGGLLTILCNLYDAVGTVWFDDIELAEINKIDEFSLPEKNNSTLTKNPIDFSSVDKGAWFVIKLKNQEKLNAIKLFNGVAPIGCKDFRVDVSLDNKSYSKIIDGQLITNTGAQEFAFKPVEARFIKLFILSGYSPYYWSLQEFEAYAGNKNVAAGNERAEITSWSTDYGSYDFFAYSVRYLIDGLTNNDTTRSWLSGPWPVPEK